MTENNEDDLVISVSCYVSQLKTPSIQVLSYINENLESSQFVKCFLSVGGLQKLLACFNQILSTTENYNKEDLVSLNLQILDALLAKENCIEYILNEWNKEEEEINQNDEKVEEEFCKLLNHESIRTNIYDIMSSLCILPLFDEMAHSFAVSVFDCYKKNSTESTNLS